MGLRESKIVHKKVPSRDISMTPPATGTYAHKSSPPPHLSYTHYPLSQYLHRPLGLDPSAVLEIIYLLSYDEEKCASFASAHLPAAIKPCKLVTFAVATALPCGKRVSIILKWILPVKRVRRLARRNATTACCHRRELGVAGKEDACVPRKYGFGSWCSRYPMVIVFG